VRARLPAVLRNRDFDLYWFGVVFSQIGLRGTFAVNLLHVYMLTGSTLQVGFVGLFQAVALLVLSPLGGAFADRLDRRRLLQVTQLLSMVVSLALALLTFADVVQPWHIYLAVLLNSSAATFDQPARQALIPALVPRTQLVQAFALINPSREIAVLVGPAVGGLLVAVAGPGAMYAVDAATYAVLVLILGILRVPPLEAEEARPSVMRSIAQGVSFVRSRPVIWQLMSLDLSATLFGAWRVVLPAIAVDVLQVGATGYGVLAAAPPAGALLGTALIFKLITRSRSGHIVLGSTTAYGLACILFAQFSALPVGGFSLALLAALAIGATDALATAVRHAAVQLETPDHIRGRVSSLYQMASRGGPALGDLNIGWLAGLLGPVTALTAGGLLPIAYAVGHWIRGGQVREYRVPEPVS
jgi:MFS family permease